MNFLGLPRTGANSFESIMLHFYVGAWYAFNIFFKAGDTVTVLIVDLSKDKAIAYAGSLSHYTVHICTDPELAFDQITLLHPDVLIMNLGLLIRAGSLPHRPKVIIALTNYWSSEVIAQASALGINEVIPIPLSKKYLAARVDELLAQPVN